MQNSIKYLALCGAMFLSPAAVWASSTTLNFNYVATNLYGDIGAHLPVATISIVDLADILAPSQLASAGEGSGGVRVTIANTGTDQFSSGVAGTKTWIGSFELNFPGTLDTNPNSPTFQSPLNGYDSNANGGIGNRWANVSGTPLGSGGIEWQESGATNGWSLFGQEYNYTGTAFSANSLTQGKSSTIDLFNGAGLSNLSVDNLLANAVTNSNSALPAIYSWIKIRGTTNTDPALRGLAASGYWGNSASTANSYRLDVVAVAAVPVPAALPLFISGLAGLGIFGRRNKV